MPTDCIAEMDTEALKDVVVAALEDIKGRDIVVMDVRRLTPMCEYMIVASGESARQTKALARNVVEKAKAAGQGVLGVEGEEVGDWVLIDLGSVVVHVMNPAVRNYYDLESLWGGARPPRPTSP